MQRLKTQPYRFAFCLALCSGIGCGAEANFTVSYVSGWPQKGQKVSVFGIKRDGIMSQAGWDALSPQLSAPFGARRCSVAYSEDLFATNPALGEALESYVRANGVTDRLLSELAPAAQGDIILLVTSQGRPRSSTDPAAVEAHAPQRRFGGGGRRAVVRGQRGAAPASDSDAPYQLSAVLYSVREQETVGVIQLDYFGSNGELAWADFRTRLESEFPGATCANWDSTTPIDPQRIRKLEAE